jgi:hypothetical protein
LFASRMICFLQLVREILPSAGGLGYQPVSEHHGVRY